EALIEAEVPAAAIDSLDAVFSNPQVLSRGMRLELSGEQAGQHIAVAGNPIKFTPHGRETHGFPPRLGEHTGEVLAGLRARAAANDAMAGAK
ncbi:MAG: CoA transferase, partial [Burkholderiales bacterium]